MATIIEELLVTLNIDAEQFRLGSQQAQDDINRTRDTAHSAANSMASDGNTGSQFFSKMRNEAMMLMGLFTAGMGLQSFVKNTVSAVSQTSILADNIGLTTQRIKALEDATEAAGGSGQAMTNQLSKFAEMSARLKRGESALDVLGRDFFSFGGDANKIKFGNPEEALKEYTRVYESIKIQAKNAYKMDEKGAEAFASQQIQKLGISADILPLLKKGEEGINGLANKYESLRGLTDKNIEDTKKAKLAWYELTIQLESFGEKVVVTAMPAMQKLSDALAGFDFPNAKKIEEASAGIQEYASAFSELKEVPKIFDSIKTGFTSLLDIENDPKYKDKGILELLGVDDTSAATFKESMQVYNKWLEETHKNFKNFSQTYGFNSENFKVNSEMWTDSIKSLLDLDIMSWTTKVTAFIDKIKELYSLVSEQVTETATTVQQQAGNMVTNAQATLADTVGGTIAKGAAMLGNEEAREATSIMSAPSKGVGIQQIMQTGAGFNVVKTAEGAVIKQEGHRNWRNNNPGNIEYGDFAKRMGAIGSDGRFAIFPTYEIGRKAKEQLIFQGKSYRDKTLTGAIARYAPPSENDTKRYQSAVLAAVGGQDKPMSQYTDAERQAIMNAMEKVEGMKKGKTTVLQPATNPKISYQTPENKTNNPQPVIIPKGEKDALGRLKQPELPQSAFVSQGMQTMNNTQSNNITINVKSTDPKQAAHEIKTSLNEHLTTPFISNMVSQ